MSSPRNHDPLTVLAIGIVAYVLAKLVHEGVGHGLTCEAVGGTLRGFSSSWSQCDRADVSGWGNRAIKAAGTLCNLVVGLGFLLALRRRGSGATIYFAWISAAVQLLMGGGYLMVDPLFRFGDWGAFIDGLEHPGLWRVGLTAIGVVVSLSTFFILRAPLELLLGDVSRIRKSQARLLCWLPYFAVGGLVMTGAAVLNRLGAQYAVTSAMATLGGTFLLVWIPVAVNPEVREGHRPVLLIQWSAGWMVAGAAALLFLLGFFGPGIMLVT